MDVLDLVNDTNQVGPGHDFMVRPFICKFDGCDRAFARKSDLARHFRIHTNERPFTCTHRGCGKAFIQRSALTVHTRVHTGERPHHCETCNKAFADSSSLARHRRIHTGKRPYGCKVNGCGRQFARRNTYLKHFKRQHPELPPPTSNSVRALHVPAYGSRAQSYLVSTGSAPGSDIQDYDASPPLSGAAHFDGSHVAQGSAYFGAGYVNGQLHSSQLAAANPVLRYHGDGAAEPASVQDRSASDLHPQPSNGMPYAEGAASNAHVGIVGQNYTGEQTVFSYGENTLPVAPNGGLMPCNNGFYFKAENPVMSQADPWGGVGGGFAPGQLSLPAVNLHPSYFPVPSHPVRAGDNKARVQSPISERGASPDLVDINSVPAIKIGAMPHQGYPMSFANDHISSSLSAATMSALHPASGQLHSAPPHMQRFHSAPGVPTLSGHPWNAPTTESRPIMRRHASDWAPDNTTAVPSRDASEASDPSKTSPPMAVKVESPQWPTASYPFAAAGRPIPYRLSSSASTASTVSSAVNIGSGPLTLPPLSIFPGTNGAPQNYSAAYQGNNQPWGQPSVHNKDSQMMTPNILGRQPFSGPTEVDDDGQIAVSGVSPKMPLARDRQASGVSILGTGLAGVTFGDRDGSLEEEPKSWTPSNPGTPDGEEEDSDDDADDSDDEDYVFGKNASVNRKGSLGKRGRGTAIPRSGSVPKRRVIA